MRAPLCLLLLFVATTWAIDLALLDTKSELRGLSELNTFHSQTQSTAFLTALQNIEANAKDATKHWRRINKLILNITIPTAATSGCSDYSVDVALAADLKSITKIISELVPLFETGDGLPQTEGNIIVADLAEMTKILADNKITTAECQEINSKLKAPFGTDSPLSPAEHDEDPLPTDSSSTPPKKKLIQVLDTMKLKTQQGALTGFLSLCYVSVKALSGHGAWTNGAGLQRYLLSNYIRFRDGAPGSAVLAAVAADTTSRLVTNPNALEWHPNGYVRSASEGNYYTLIVRPNPLVAVGNRVQYLPFEYNQCTYQELDPLNGHTWVSSPVSGCHIYTASAPGQPLVIMHCHADTVSAELARLGVNRYTASQPQLIAAKAANDLVKQTNADAVITLLNAGGAHVYVRSQQITRLDYFTNNDGFSFPYGVYTGGAWQITVYWWQMGSVVATPIITPARVW